MSRKKIIILISLILVAVLATTIIVLAVVKTNNKPNLAAADDIVVSIEGRQTYNVSKNSEIQSEKELYDQIISEYNEMFNVPILNAMFNGVLGGYRLSESLSKPTLGNNTITLKWNDAQIFYKDGKPYYSEYNSSRLFEFHKIEFSIEDKNEFKEIRLVATQVVENSDGSTSEYYCEVIAMANTKQIYDFLTDRYNDSDK